MREVACASKKAIGAEGHNIRVVSVDGKFRLEYGWSLRAFPFGVVIVLLVTMLSVFVFISPDPEGYPEGIWVYLVFISFGIVLPWLLFIEVFGTRTILSGEGIRAESWWRGSRFLNWQEIQNVHYSSLSQCIVLKGERGKIRIHPWVSNMDRFLETLNEMMPEERIQKNLAGIVKMLRLEA
jgi:hypothetical protein